MAFQGLGAIGQIQLSVTDVDRSVEFYRDVLGIPFLFRVEGQPMAFFDCDGVRLYLGVPEAPEFRSNPLLYFVVDDLDRPTRRFASAVFGSATRPTWSIEPDPRSCG